MWQSNGKDRFLIIVVWDTLGKWGKKKRVLQKPEAVQALQTRKSIKAFIIVAKPTRLSLTHHYHTRGYWKKKLWWCHLGHYGWTCFARREASPGIKTTKNPEKKSKIIACLHLYHQRPDEGLANWPFSACRLLVLRLSLLLSIERNFQNSNTQIAGGRRMLPEMKVPGFEDFYLTYQRLSHSAW